MSAVLLCVLKCGHNKDDQGVFSGIIETTSRILTAEKHAGVVRILIKKPIDYNDLSVGDSVAVNGVCLTVESFDSHAMQFALGEETLKVTGWTVSEVKGQVVNLERSLRLGDRIHGHIVTGHVDARARILETKMMGEGLWLRVEIPESLRPLIWPKGSVTVNGVSLTVNEVGGGAFTVGLIPETLKRTNLGALQVSQWINLEADNMARGLVHLAQIQSARNT